MPHSRREGKPWMLEHILAEKPISVLDVGAGAGTYYDLLAEPLADLWGDIAVVLWTAVEIFAPYIERYRLTEHYDRVIVADFLHPSVHPRPHDVVILGDVLEHVEVDRAEDMWDKAQSLAVKAVYLCVPIDGFEQGSVDGNDHEIHRHHWTFDEVMELLPGITDSWKGRQKGCFRGEGLAE